MRRREFISLVGGAAAWPLTAYAQQGERMRRIGDTHGPCSGRSGRASQRRSVRADFAIIGLDHGRNVQIDIRWGVADAASSRR